MATTRQIALLRGINVGGHKRVAMAELRELLSGLGYGDVRTLLQSGNVVLSSAVSGARLERRLEQQIAAGLGVSARAVVRTPQELAAVVAHDPLRDVARDPSRYLVSFLAAKPEPRVVRELVAGDYGKERLAALGRELYAWHPDGIHDSPLAKLLTERRLGVAVTARNWKTVTKLLALAGE